MLEVEGKTYDALIKEVDYNPLKGCIDEIDFQALVQGEKVHSTAEIHLINLEKLVAGTRSRVSRCCMKLHSRHCRLHW